MSSETTGWVVRGRGRRRDRQGPLRAPRLASSLALTLAVVAGAAASGATITVDTTADEAGIAGTGCSLREAITAANTNAAFGGCSAGSGVDTIALPAGLYQLTIANPGGTNEDDNASGDLDILQSLTLTGAGSATTFVQAGSDNGNGIDKVIAANPYCTNGVDVSITGVTVRWGRNTQPAGAPDFSYTGGGVDYCAGGPGGTFALADAVVAENTNVNGYGGGLNIDSAAGSSTITISNVTFDHNRTLTTTNTGTGGGINIFSPQPAVTVTGCTFTGNSVANPTGGGGAIYFRPASITAAGSLSIVGSTFSGNTAGGIGGAIATNGYFAATTVTIQDSDFTGNTATNSFGGALHLDNSALNTAPWALTNLRITGNHAGISGGGIFVGQANVTIAKSRIAGNTAPTGSGLHRSVDAGTATAAGNWWGCSTGPAAAPCDTATTTGGTLGFTPWYRDLLGPATTLVTNQSGTLTASFLTDSSNAAVPLADLGRLIGLPVTWAASSGALSATQTSVQAAGTATATFTATAVGAPVISARVDADSTAPVSPNVLTVTVNKAATTATIGSHGPDPTVTGQAAVIGVTVAGAFGNAPTAPTGTITVTAGADACSIALPALSCNLAFPPPARGRSPRSTAATPISTAARPRPASRTPSRRPTPRPRSPPTAPIPPSPVRPSPSPTASPSTRPAPAPRPASSPSPTASTPAAPRSRPASAISC